MFSQGNPNKVYNLVCGPFVPAHSSGIDRFLALVLQVGGHFFF